MADVNTSVSSQMTRPQFGTRGVSVALRTWHLASFGILLGGHVFAVEGDLLLPAFYMTISSGIGLMALEVYVVGRIWFFMGKGVMVLVKLAVLFTVPLFWEYRVSLLLLVLVIASISSHMPARYRHYSFRHGRVVQAGERPGTVYPRERVSGGVKSQ